MKLFQIYFFFLLCFVFACNKKSKKTPYAVTIKPNAAIRTLTPADLLDGFSVRFHSNYNATESFLMEIDFFDPSAKCLPRTGELSFSMNVSNHYTVTIDCKTLPQNMRGVLEIRLLNREEKLLASAKADYALDEIWSLSDFEKIPEIGLDRNYKQMTNIDGSNHEPISAIKKFSGEYEGNNYFFNNIEIRATENDKAHFGLFDTIGSTGSVINWRLKNIKLLRIVGNTGENHSGILAGKNEGKIYFVSVDSSLLEDKIAKALGGVVGNNSGQIYFTSSKNNRFVGGIDSKIAYFVGKNTGIINTIYAQNISQAIQTFYGVVTDLVPGSIKRAYYKEYSPLPICIQKDFRGERDNCNVTIEKIDTENLLVVFDSTENPRFSYNESLKNYPSEITDKVKNKPSSSVKVFKENGTLFWE